MLFLVVAENFDVSKLTSISKSVKKYGNNWEQRNESTAKLKGLLPIGQQVRIREVEKDKYNRTVGEVFVGNHSINLTLVQAGAAVVYRQYLKGCAGSENQYLSAEQQARSQRIGFWNQANPVMPWDFRRGAGARKPPASTPKPKPVGQQ